MRPRIQYRNGLALEVLHPVLCVIIIHFQKPRSKSSVRTELAVGRRLNQRQLHTTLVNKVAIIPDNTPSTFLQLMKKESCRNLHSSNTKE